MKTYQGGIMNVELRKTGTEIKGRFNAEDAEGTETNALEFDFGSFVVSQAYNGELRKAGTEGEYLFTAESAEDAETSLCGSDTASTLAKQAGMSNAEGRNAKEAHAVPFPVFLNSPFKFQIG